jgi:hypothetical protein
MPFDSVARLTFASTTIDRGIESLLQLQLKIIFSA